MMKHALLLGLAGACTVGPHGGAPPTIGRAVAPGAAPPAGGHLGCARDSGGAHFATAAPLEAGVTPGCVDGAEVDVFAVTAPASANAGALYEVTITASEHVCVKLYDQDRGILGSSDCAEEAEQASLWFALAPTTIAYLRIERTHDEPSPYRLQVSERVLDDKDEPANGWKQAVPLALGTKHAALLHPVLNDETCSRDVYQVAVPTPGTLAVTVDPSSDDVHARVELYDAERALVGSADAGDRGAIARLSETIKAGTYYVQVVEVFADAYGIADEPSTVFTKPYQIEVHLDGAKRRVSHR
jgi:hypothetical protein